MKAILVSGQETAEAPEATVMRAWLRARDVPAADVWSDGGGTRTRETMNRAAAFYGVTDAVVCTQTVNMARSIYLARQAGIDAVGLALPTTLGRSTRYLATESLKTTLAFAESSFSARPRPRRRPFWRRVEGRLRGVEMSNRNALFDAVGRLTTAERAAVGAHHDFATYSSRPS